MKWSRLVTIALALSVGLNIGLVIRTEKGRFVPAPGFDPPPFIRGPSGEGTGRRPGEFARYHLDRLGKRLDLDEERRERLRAVTAEMMPLVLEQRTQVVEKRSAIRDAYRRGDADPATVRALVRELNRAQAALDSLVAETMLREMEMLTPDQRREYFRSMPWEGRHGERPDRGRGPRRKR